MTIEEILKAYKPGDNRQKLVEVIYAAFSGWVTQCAWVSARYEDSGDDFWVEEMISNFWV